MSHLVLRFLLLVSICVGSTKSLRRLRKTSMCLTLLIWTHFNLFQRKECFCQIFLFHLTKPLGAVHQSAVFNFSGHYYFMSACFNVSSPSLRLAAHARLIVTRHPLLWSTERGKGWSRSWPPHDQCLEQLTLESVQWSMVCWHHRDTDWLRSNTTQSSLGSLGYWSSVIRKYLMNSKLFCYDTHSASVDISWDCHRYKWFHQ